jgi:hypothetical protein
MNAVEIEEAVSALASAPFDAGEFPYAFLAAFGNKDTTIKRLRSGSSNASDIPGGVLQRSNIHMAVCPPGEIGATLAALRLSPKTSAAKAKFVLATDGVELEAEDLASGETIACAYGDFARHFGFFLPLAGISTVRQITDNPIDIKATGRLNKLYVELLKDNEDWGTGARRHELNQFMARLIFCFFAEDTGIFQPHLFTRTIEQMSDSQSGNTHEVITELFRAMDTKIEDRKAANFRPWAEAFPYVNGGLFTGKADSPRFSRIARSYLLRAGELDWQEINPDIFGSMIQAVADDDERGSLGMHYSSVPNILKVLDPLFLDDLRAQLEAAGDNVRKLKNLRRRIASIRVFDPACGSGNFLVIAYIKMREIEHETIKRLDDDAKSWIKLENFYGIEIKGFAVEIARLSLLIAEFQSDARLINQQEAWLNVLPLHRTGQIHVGNALRMDWLKVCPPAVRMEQQSADLFGTPTDQTEIDFDANEAETYICGNPPYLGAKKKTADQVQDMKIVGLGDSLLLDYVAAFLVKAYGFINAISGSFALVATSSICQGEQVSLLWGRLLDTLHIFFAYRPFKWSNSAAKNAGVWCTVVGLTRLKTKSKVLYNETNRKICRSISPYLIEGDATIVTPRPDPISELPKMDMGSNPVDGKHLIFSVESFNKIARETPSAIRFFRQYGGTEEILSSEHRYCLWVKNEEVEEAMRFDSIRQAIESCRRYRMTAGQDARRVAKNPHRFSRSTYRELPALHIGKTIGNRYLCVPATLRRAGFVSSDAAFTIYEPKGYELAIITSALHKAWAEAVAGRLGNGVRYGTTVVYNTFPMPTLTEKQKADLIRCAEDILLTREAHFPATIAELYDPEKMPDDLKRAHERNDETLERIYIGRRFRNDTERLEKLFDLYAKMAQSEAGKAKEPKKGKAKS